MTPDDQKPDDSESTPSVPPVDLNRPVTNPELVSALDAFDANQDEAHLDVLLTELNRAVYLVATLLDEASISASDTPGNVVIEEGSLIKVITASDPDGNEVLPLFTDWEAIQQWIQEPVQTLVMPAADAWQFALGGYHGVLINPAGTCLPLNRPQVEELQRLADSA